MQAAGFDPPSMRWDESNLPEQWEKFERHARLVFSGPLKGKEEKVSFLLLWVGDKGRDIRHTWTDISDADSKKLDTFYKRFKEHVQPTLNPIFARYQFNNEKLIKLRCLTKDSILKDYSSAFKGIDLLPGECTIHTDSNMQPVVHPPRRVPIALKNSQTRTRSYGAT